MRGGPRPLTQRLIELACRAPSTHNTQPWRWHIRSDLSVELWADRSRQLPVADGEGRNLAISCGAALHHLITAGHAVGATPVVELLPVFDQPDLLATIRITLGPAATDEAEALDIIQRRCTDRRRFTSWPIPDAHLHHLAGSAQGWGVDVVPLTDVAARLHTETLLHRALTFRRSDARTAATECPEGLAAEVPNELSGAVVGSSDGLMAICTAQDDQHAWLAAGLALSAVWLQATRDGLSLVPLSQVIEVPATREALRRDVLTGGAHPQILMRIGWQEIGRASRSPTPRRSLAEVLIPSPGRR